MALISQSRPSDQSLAAMATPPPENLSSKSKKKVKATTWGFPSDAPDRGMNGKTVKNKGKRFRLSDTSGNVTAGGPGSGRKKEVEDYLKSQGFNKSKVYGGKPNGDGQGGESHWTKETHSNIHGTANNQGYTSHHVMVNSDGTWLHSVTGGHHGSAGDITHLSLAATGGIEGRTLESLKRIFARKFSQGTRKKLAKTGVAEPDGSYPIKNKKDYENAVKDLNRTGRKASDVAHVNKRAKQLGLKAGGPGSGRKPDADWHSVLTKHGFTHLGSRAAGDYTKHTYGNGTSNKITVSQDTNTGRYPEWSHRSVGKEVGNGDDLTSLEKHLKPQLGIRSTAMGPGLTAKKKVKADGVPSKNEDAIEYYSKGKKIKALGEDDLSNKKIMKFMKEQSASVLASGDIVKTKFGNGRVQGHIDNGIFLVTTRSGNRHIHASHLEKLDPGIVVKANKGTLRIIANKAGRRIIVATSDKGERTKIHATLKAAGYKFKGDGLYVHANGDRVKMNYKAGGVGSGRKAGMALGKMLRQALINRMSPAIGLAKQGSSIEKQAGHMMRNALMNRMGPAVDIAKKGAMTSSKMKMRVALTKVHGFKMKSSGKYIHANGDKVTMNYEAGGPGSGRRPSGQATPKTDAKANRAYKLMEMHEKLADKYHSNAEDAHGKGDHSLGRQLDSIALAHDRAGQHFDKAAEHYDYGREKAGDLRFAKGMSIAKGK